MCLVVLKLKQILKIEYFVTQLQWDYLTHFELKTDLTLVKRQMCKTGPWPTFVLSNQILKKRPLYHCANL